jgi:hypothetical protein
MEFKRFSAGFRNYGQGIRESRRLFGTTSSMTQKTQPIEG